jgi:hypothetical protein
MADIATTVQESSSRDRRPGNRNLAGEVRRKKRQVVSEAPPPSKLSLNSSEEGSPLDDRILSFGEVRSFAYDNSISREILYRSRNPTQDTNVQETAQNEEIPTTSLAKDLSEKEAETRLIEYHSSKV